MDKKQLREFVKENTSLKEIVKASGFRSVLQGLANSSLNYYGFKSVPIRTDFAPDGEVAWISDKECYINLDSVLDKGLNFVERKKLALGKLTHEVFGHGLHTDFARAAELQEKKVFPYDEYFDGFQQTAEVEKAYGISKELFDKLFFEIANIVEDPVIEHLAVQKYPGFSCYVDALTERLRQHISAEVSQSQGINALLNLLLCQARGCFSDENLKLYPELKDTQPLFAVESMPNYEDRLHTVGQIMQILWKYFNEYFEQADKIQQALKMLSQFADNNAISDDQSEMDEQEDGQGQSRSTMVGQANMRQSGQSSQSSSDNSTKGSQKGSEGTQNGSKDGKTEQSSTDSQNKENAAQSASVGSSNDKSDEDDTNGKNAVGSKDKQQKDSEDGADKNQNKNGSSQHDKETDEDEQTSIDSAFGKELQNVFSKAENEVNKSSDSVLNKIFAEQDLTNLAKQYENNEFGRFIKEGAVADLSHTINDDFKTDVDAYNAIFTSREKAIAKTLAKKVLKVLKERRKGNVFYEQDEGIMLDVNAYASGSERVFMDVTAPTKRPLCAVEIMVDESGSMGGDREEAARLAAMCLEAFCRDLKIPFGVYGHCEFAGVMINEYLKMDDVKNNINASKLVSMRAHNACNHDGYGLRFGISKLVKRPETQKFLFVLSDGRPNGTGYGHTQMVHDMEYLNKICKKSHIAIIPIAIGDDFNNLQAIYGKELVDGRDLQKLPTEIARILLAKIKKLL